MGGNKKKGGAGMKRLKRDYYVGTKECREFNYDFKDDGGINLLMVSGGKDSSAMWLMAWESGLKNVLPINFDGGWEWPIARKAIIKLEKITGQKCLRLYPDRFFDESFRTKGWPRINCRWCTSTKRDTLQLVRNYIKERFRNRRVTEHIGIAWDERNRSGKGYISREKINLPLVKAKITERACLRICGRYGLNWDNYYMSFDRLLCWCCPLKNIGDWRELYISYPDLWEKIRMMDKIAPEGRKLIWANYSRDMLEERFEKEIKDKGKVFHQPGRRSKKRKKKKKRRRKNISEIKK